MRHTIAVLLVLLAGSPVFAEDLSNVRLIGCHDGDTCEFDILMPSVLGSGLGVRLAGIDTPEINGKCPQEIALAAKARDFLNAAVARKQLTLTNVSRDKFFRIDATVIADGQNINQLMIEKGHAVPYHGKGPRHDWCRP